MGKIPCRPGEGGGRRAGGSLQRHHFILCVFFRGWIHSVSRFALFSSFALFSRVCISSDPSRSPRFYSVFFFFRRGSREAYLTGGALLQLPRSPTAAFFRAQGEMDNLEPFFAAGCRFAAPFHDLFPSGEASPPLTREMWSQGQVWETWDGGCQPRSNGIQRGLGNGTLRGAP